MQLSSSAFSNGGTIPSCDGEDLSPPFQRSEPPTDTRSFVGKASSGQSMISIAWVIAAHTVTGLAAINSGCL